MDAKTPVGIQDDAERRPDRRRAGEAHGEDRREDDRLHRLQRSLRRELVQGVHARSPKRPASRSSRRSITQRTDPSVTGQALKLIAAKPDAVLIAARRRPGRAAADHAARPGLQGHDLPDARGRHRRFHPSRQGQGRGDGAGGGSDAGDRRDPRFESDQEGRADVYRRLREAVRPEARDVRRQHVGLRASSCSARFRSRWRRRSPAPRHSARRCATRSSTSARSSAARACSTCRPATTTGWTSARACWSS